jgi:PAS domain S-box-containing protein
MRAENPKKSAENLFEGNSEIALLLRSVETWSEDLKTAVQLRLNELEQVNQQEKTPVAFALPPQDNTQSPSSHQAAKTDAFRVSLIDALRSLTDANEIQATAARILGEYLGANRVIYIEVLPNGEEVVVHKNYTDGVAELRGLYRLEDFGRNLVDDHRSGQTMIVPDVTTHPKYGESERARFRTINIAAHVDVPLIKNDQFVALLAVHQAIPRQWTDHEVKRAEETAERTWAAVEQSRVEAALRESEEQSRNLLESITDAFFAVDENWRFTYVNQTAQTLINRTADDLIGKSFWEEFPGVNDSAFEQMHRRVMRDRVAESLIEFYPDHDRWYEVRSYPAVNGITMYFNNVTDRIQAEATLRESEEKTRNVLESIAEAFFALDQDWRFTYMNHSGEALLARAPGDLIGKNFWEEYPGVRDNEFEIVYRKAMEDRVPGTLTAFYPDHDRWYNIRTYPAANGIAVYFNNVTAQIQAEAALKVSNTRLKLLSEVANDLLLNEDPKAFLSSLVAKVSAFLGLEIYFNYLFDADQQRLQLNTYGGISEELAKSAEILKLGQGVCGYAVQHRQPIIVEKALEADHSLGILVQSTGIRAYASHPLIVGDFVLGTLGLGTRQRDCFTPDELDLMQAVANQVAVALERSRLVAELQSRAEGLAQANRIKDEFLAVLSHELRSPLNPILGWTRLLQSGKLDPARQVSALETIERNAKLQSQLIEDLLDISRIMQGKLTLTAAPTSLLSVISAAVETVSLAAEAKNIHISLDLDPKIAPVSGDAARLQQMVWNLLTNAVKFTSNGGQVTVELRQVEFNQGLLSNPMAQMRVIDTGKGITPHFLPYVFEYFRQEDGSTTRRFGGLGLGLAIVRQIVELHGGTVTVESEGENQGTTFSVQLPSLQQALSLVPEPSQAQAASETRLNDIQILLVDDDADTREYQTFLLEQNGAKVVATASGLEALQALDQFMPAVIISDIGMAEIDGYMLMQQIRSRPPTQGGTIPAIALTAYAAEIDQKRAIQVGFQMHLTKPLEPEQFVSAIVNLLNPN